APQKPSANSGGGHGGAQYTASWCAAALPPHGGRLRRERWHTTAPACLGARFRGSDGSAMFPPRRPAQPAPEDPGAAPARRGDAWFFPCLCGIAGWPTVGSFFDGLARSGGRFYFFRGHRLSALIMDQRAAESFSVIFM